MLFRGVLSRRRITVERENRIYLFFVRSILLPVRVIYGCIITTVARDLNPRSIQFLSTSACPLIDARTISTCSEINNNESVGKSAGEKPSDVARVTMTCNKRNFLIQNARISGQERRN